VITNSTYTPKARELASKTGVRLLDGAEIVTWITKATRNEQPTGDTIAEAARRRAEEEARRRAYRHPHPDDR
jgi:diketogulonate reductase-like aldo/keto reductase